MREEFLSIIIKLIQSTRLNQNLLVKVYPLEYKICAVRYLFFGEECFYFIYQKYIFAA